MIGAIAKAIVLHHMYIILIYMWYTLFYKNNFIRRARLRFGKNQEQRKNNPKLGDGTINAKFIFLNKILL